LPKIHVSMLVPGMRLSKPVYGLDEAVLWVGHALTVRAIKRLKLHRIEYVDVEGTEDEALAEVPTVELIPPESREKAISSVKASFQEAVHHKPSAHSPEIEETARDLVHFLTRHQRLISSISEIRSLDEYLLEHSVNVSALAIMTGACLGLGEDELYQLGVCGLMHDIGKVKVPQAILNKPGRLTADEFREVQKHTVYALELLSYDPIAAKVASQHHERYDGSGYPFMLKRDEIHVYAQIIGLADVYDAMTVDRCYRDACQAREVIELIAATGNYHFEYRIVKAFLSNIAPYPVGSKVLLSNGQSAIVVSASHHFPIYPRIRLLTDERGEQLSTFEDIDLHTGYKGLYIVRQLSTQQAHTDSPRAG